MIEKEVRGSISLEQVDRIKEYADKQAWKESSYKQVSIYCDTDTVESIGSVTSGKGRIIIDIRGDVVKLKIKVGNALSFDRQEYVVKISKNEVESLGVLLKMFGVTHGFVRTFDRTDYITKEGVQLTIKLNCLMGDHFELERNNDLQEVLLKFDEIINTFNLKVWSQEELASAIENDHNKVTSQEIIKVIMELI